VGDSETLRSDDYLGFWCDLNIAKPISVGTEGVHHDHLRTILSKFHDFKDGVAHDANATTGVNQQQESVSEQPTASPTIQIHGCPEEAV
jgi:hypothetical protein